MIKFKKNKKNKKNKKAFSFMELLTTIIIIGIIISTATVSFKKIRENSRDTKRIADIKQIQSALELYYSDNGKYPETLGSSISSGTKIYLEKVPEAITPVDGDCSAGENSYSYTTSDGNNNYYYLSFCIGKNVDDYDSGKKIAVPGDILEPSSICENLIDSRDNQSYATVQIGNQCWMAENLNIGIMLGGNYFPAKNGIIEKYCAYDNEVNCNIYGGLYQWDEAMQYVETTGAKGICPDGWHIPTNNELDTLISYINSNPYYLCNGNNGKAFASNSSWHLSDISCAIGNNQTDNNDSGFNALPASVWYLAFQAFGYGSYFWSSSVYDFDEAIGYSVAYNKTNIDLSFVRERIMGFSIRCIKD